MRHRRALALFTGLAAVAAVAGSAISLQASAATRQQHEIVTPKVATTTTYTPPNAYDPTTGAVGGSTDVYHCTVIDPGLTQDQYVTSSQLLPDQTPEVHHAILFLIDPAHVAQVQSLNAGSGGNGWTCFGSPLNQSSAFDGTPWLGAWVPGHGADVFPAGTGVYMPAGSLIVMQIHYNLLNGTTPDRSSVKLTTVPAAGSSLKALTLRQFVAPPDLPCPKGVTGALCSRSASLTDLGNRFGSSSVDFVNGLEAVCGHNYAALKPSKSTKVSTTCTMPIGGGQVIRQITPHMHFIGEKAKVQLISGSKTTTLTNVTNYSFDSQISYALAKPVTTKSFDAIKITCTYDPTLRQKLPQLRPLPARYVTWGDGSSDEMCLAIVGTTSS